MSQGYITDLRHFLDEQGTIPSELPRPARELASFLALVVDAVTSSFPEPRWSIETEIRCRTPGCRGEIVGALDTVDAPLHWYCMECGAHGQITGWRRSRWDNVDYQPEHDLLHKPQSLHRKDLEGKKNS